MEKGRAKAMMDRRRMMLCEIVCEVVGTAPPEDVKFTIADVIADPIKSHIHGFGALLLDGAVGNAKSARIVGLNGSRLLWITKIHQSGAVHACIFGIVEGGPQFSFGSGGHYGVQDGSVDVERPVERNWCRIA